MPICGNTVKNLSKIVTLAGLAAPTFVYLVHAMDGKPDGNLTLQIGFGADGITDTIGMGVNKHWRSGVRL